MSKEHEPVHPDAKPAKKDHGVATVAPKGPTPRIVKDSERCPPNSGLKRFKIRAEVPGFSQPVKYVLADSQKSAEGEYLKVMKLEGKADVSLVVQTLAD